jgi:hypothetical protein
MLKKILIAVFLFIMIGAGIVLYQWNKPHTKVEDVTGININAMDLSKEYQLNEKAADTKYLNKVIEVSGTISETDKNQDGGTMIVLQTGDPITVVQCSMREKGITAAKGQKVVIKGFCSGNGITGVTLTDCIIK